MVGQEFYQQVKKKIFLKNYAFTCNRLLAGFANKINQAGVKYYRNLFKELRDNNIEPLVTLFHWDTPQGLQDIGGWTNPEIVEHFLAYAKICFESFGDLVKYWATFNEPKQPCHGGYGDGSEAPAIRSAQGEYLCSHHVLLAHSEAYHLYNNTFRKAQKGKYMNFFLVGEYLFSFSGKVGIVIDSANFQPATNKSEDIAAAETAFQFTVILDLCNLHTNYVLQLKLLTVKSVNIGTIKMS